MLINILYIKVGRVSDTPAYYANTLKVEATHQLLASLVVSLRSQPAHWLKEFIALEGIHLLVNLLLEADKSKRSNDISEQCVYCIKAIMNTRVGITGCVETGPSLGLALVMAMDGGSDATRLVALELLTTLALLNAYPTYIIDLHQ